jgi:hypothetical protein
MPTTMPTRSGAHVHRRDIRGVHLQHFNARLRRRVRLAKYLAGFDRVILEGMPVARVDLLSGGQKV